MINQSNKEAIRTTVIGFVAVVALSLLSGTLGLGLLPFVVFPLLALANPKSFIKFSLFVPAFILLLADPSYKVSIPDQSLTMLQIIPSDSSYLQNYDEAILVGALLVILKNPLSIRSMPVPSFMAWFLAVVFVIGLSWLLNGLSLLILVNYLSTYLRFPILFLAFLSIPDWSLKQLHTLFKIILIICLPAQFIFGLVQNVGTLLTGNVVLIDGLTGTFNYPSGEWSTTFVTVGMLYALTRMLDGKTIKYSGVFICGLIYLGSASQNLNTVVAIASFIVVVSSHLLFQREQTGSFVQRGVTIVATLLVVLVVLGSIGLFVMDSIDPDLVNQLTGYFNAKLVQQNVVLGVSPKILTYYNLFGLFGNGTINMLWGVGPGMYLSGLALSNFGSDLTARYSTVGQIESLLGGTGRGDAMENNVVAFSGEIGIIGLAAMYMLLFVVIWYIHKNSRFVRDPQFKAVGPWVIFTIVFFCIYSSLVLVFESQPFIILLAILSGIAVKVIELSKQSSVQQTILAD